MWADDRTIYEMEIVIVFKHLLHLELEYLKLKHNKFVLEQAILQKYIYKKRIKGTKISVY